MLNSFKLASSHKFPCLLSVLFCINRLVLTVIYLCRKTLQQVVGSNDETSIDYLPNRAGVSDVANLVLKLLPSKDGVVLRRLLMTAVS